MSLIKRKGDSRLNIALIILLLVTGCAQNNRTGIKPPERTDTSATETVIETSLPAQTTQITPPSAPTSIPDPINPLTGLAVADPSLLDLPAVLVSISTFPVTARPQAGLSFAPYVFEIYITEGTTRYLTTFYGEFPAPEAPVTGSCETRNAPFVQTDLIIGNRIWLDENRNNVQDDWERGIGGVCVNLYDDNQTLLQQTSTDSNGYYGFNVSTGKYFVAVEKPNNMEFSQKDAGDEGQDSDVDQASGWSDALDISSTFLHLDAGLILLEESLPTSELPPARVGPVRSGRLIYADIADFFAGSCLIFAYASAEVLVELPVCAFVDHNIQGGGYMLDISEMERLVQEREDPQTRSNYASNIFSAEPPEGGAPASRLDVFVAWLNQTGWAYDPLSGSWWRYVDNGKAQTAGILHTEIDRLTGRQLLFENVIVLFTEHDVISPTNLDIHLDRGLTGKALLFRDGQMYSIRWSTENDSPIQFQFEDGRPFPLKPGHTWVTVVTPLTALTEKKPGEWWLRFHQPPGSK
ncbi:MAG TPA: SdrD B-like domain-containing protein [Anaerolineales bacterium]